MPSTFTRSIIGAVGVVAVERGDVEDRVAALDRALGGRPVEQVDALVAHVGALLGELARDVRCRRSRSRP